MIHPARECTRMSVVYYRSVQLVCCITSYPWPWRTAHDLHLQIETSSADLHRAPERGNGNLDHMTVVPSHMENAQGPRSCTYYTRKHPALHPHVGYLLLR